MGSKKKETLEEKILAVLRENGPLNLYEIIAVVLESPGSASAGEINRKVRAMIDRGELELLSDWKKKIRITRKEER